MRQASEGRVFIHALNLSNYQFGEVPEVFAEFVLTENATTSN